MNIATKAIVFSTIKYGESSLIAKCYTQEFGVRSYMLKGILSGTKKMVRPAYFQPLMQLEIVSTNLPKGNFQYIKEVKISHHYNNLYFDAKKSSVSFFISELCFLLFNDEFKDNDLFNFFVDYLTWYDSCSVGNNFHLKFLIDLSSYLGFYPDASGIDKKYFDIETGVFVDKYNDHLLIVPPCVEIFKELIKSDLEGSDKITMNRSQRNAILDYILKYYTCHYVNFREPRSWKVLKDIFN